MFEGKSAKAHKNHSILLLNYNQQTKISNKNTSKHRWGGMHADL